MTVEEFGERDVSTVSILQKKTENDCKKRLFDVLRLRWWVDNAIVIDQRNEGEESSNATGLKSPRSCSTLIGIHYDRSFCYFNMCTNVYLIISRFHCNLITLMKKVSHFLRGKALRLCYCRMQCSDPLKFNNLPLKTMELKTIFLDGNFLWAMYGNVIHLWGWV